MIRLIRIEFLKLRKSNSMWVLLGLYLACLVLIAFSGNIILGYLADAGVQYNGLDPTILPIYDFVDIWQNLSWLGGFFKVFPAFLIVISMCNEFQFKTHRQNIMDGMSRLEFFFSKLSFAGFLALLSALVILVIGLVLGFLYSPVADLKSVFTNSYFLLGHFYELLLYFLFAMLIALVIRKTGIAIVILLMYTWFIEPIGAAILSNWYPEVAGFFPLESISALIRFPFSKYILLYTQNFIALADLAKASLWALVFSGFIYYQLVRRDF